MYSGPTNPKKDTRDFELKKLDGQIICTDPRCTALRKVKKGKKFVDRPNDTPLTACEGLWRQVRLRCQVQRADVPQADGQGREH